MTHRITVTVRIMTMIAVRIGDGNDTRVLEVHNAVEKQWEEVCSAGWNQTFASLACKQLGYR